MKSVLQADWQSLGGKEKGLSGPVPDVVRCLLVEPTLAMLKVVTLAKSMSRGIKTLT